MIASIAAEQLEALRAARAKARATAWKAGAGPKQLIIDLDATPLTSHSEKDQAKGNYKGGFGFHPLMAYLEVVPIPVELHDDPNLVIRR